MGEKLTWGMHRAYYGGELKLCTILTKYHLWQLKLFYNSPVLLHSNLADTMFFNFNKYPWLKILLTSDVADEEEEVLAPRTPTPELLFWIRHFGGGSTPPVPRTDFQPFTGGVSHIVLEWDKYTKVGRCNRLLSSLSASPFQQAYTTATGDYEELHKLHNSLSITPLLYTRINHDSSILFCNMIHLFQIIHILQQLFEWHYFLQMTRQRQMQMYCLPPYLY